MTRSRSSRMTSLQAEQQWMWIHCRSSEYNSREQRQTCVACEHPLSDNQLVRDAFILNTTATWAKQQLAILHDMAKDRGDDWYAEKAQKIADGIQLLDANRKLD